MGMSEKLTRREMFKRAGCASLIGGVGFPFFVRAAKQGVAPARLKYKRWVHGAVVGENTAATVGEQVLAQGGNAVDAAVTAALVACISAPARSGIGGYGGHMVIGFANGRS